MSAPLALSPEECRPEHGVFGHLYSLVHRNRGNPNRPGIWEASLPHFIPWDIRPQSRWFPDAFGASTDERPPAPVEGGGSQTSGHDHLASFSGAFAGGEGAETGRTVASGPDLATTSATEAGRHRRASSPPTRAPGLQTAGPCPTPEPAPGGRPRLPRSTRSELESMGTAASRPRGGPQNSVLSAGPRAVRPARRGRPEEPASGRRGPRRTGSGRRYGGRRPD